MKTVNFLEVFFCPSMFIVPFIRANLVSPWNENARTEQKQQTNWNRAIWLVYRTDTNPRAFWLVKRMLGGGGGNFTSKNFSEINRYFALTSCCNKIGQSNNAILGYSLAGRRRGHHSGFDLFIHWLIKQRTNTYWNQFSRSYKNHSNGAFLLRCFVFWDLCRGGCRQLWVGTWH